LSPADGDREVAVSTLHWQGLEIEVRYEADWLSIPSSRFRTAHLELRSTCPDRAPLPVTETGYRSRFLPREEVEALAGPEGYARAWLDEAARDPAWRDRDDGRQLSLF